MQTDDVINACQVLEKAGKKPSVALVKTKLSSKVPLALIVKGIQQFQSSLLLGQLPDSSVNNQADTKNSSATELETNDCACACASKLISLEKDILLMSAHITKLQAQVKGLTEQ